ncbi:MAG: hypothetical protein ACYC0L_01230 [Thermoleophilia bacterium]
MMNLSPLQLEGYYARQINFSLKQSIEEKTEFFSPTGLQYIPVNFEEIDPFQMNVAIQGAVRDDDSSRWRFELTIKSTDLEDNNFPYEFEIAVVGYFKSHLENNPKNEHLIRTNGISILYSTAREMLASASSRSLFPGILLPSMSFADSSFVQPEQATEEAPKNRSKAAKAKKKKVSKKPAAKASG